MVVQVLLMIIYFLIGKISVFVKNHIKYLVTNDDLSKTKNVNDFEKSLESLYNESLLYK